MVKFCAKTIEKRIAEAKEQHRLIQIIKQVKQKITVYHTRSHVGIKRNEEVDKLCNVKVHREDRRSIRMEGTKTAEQIKSQTKNYLKLQRKKRLIDNSEITQSNTKELMGETMKNEKEPPKEHKRLPRRVGILLSRARTNRWINCKWFLNFIKVEENAACPSCGVVEDTKHILNNCLAFENKRQQIYLKLNYKYHKISDMLYTKDPKEIKMLNNFLIDIDDERNEMRIINHEGEQAVEVER